MDRSKGEMKNPSPRVILFINLSKEHARDLGEEIRKELSSRNIQTDIFSYKGNPGFTIKEGYHVAFSLGGDGTVLSAARIMSPLNVPILPVNLGTFGFIAGVNPSGWKDAFTRWQEGKARISRRLMLELNVERDNKILFRGSCLNDVVISYSGIAKIIRLRVSYIETGQTDLINLGQYRSDGLIISTPTGSTAYSMAAGGPIIDPEMEALILNPICPFTLSNRPMALPAEDTVLVEVERGQRSGVILTVDGQVTEKLKGGDKIYLKKTPYQCLLIESGKKNFYQALKTKFGWTGGAEEDPRDENPLEAAGERRLSSCSKN